MTSGTGSNALSPVPSGAGICAVLPALALALAGLLALTGHALTRPGLPGQYLVMTRPGLHRADVLDMVHSAGGGVIAFAALPGMSIALSGDDEFVDRVRLAGAWAVLPAPGALGCVASDAEGL
ncbi:hypothetical protein [Paracoccus sp. Ld10]|uniref:hypothetical protein n=1 Tax=Paracoccus sp. Ld10 TaxID=649158 RepID=UPI00386EB958